MRERARGLGFNKFKHEQLMAALGKTEGERDDALQSATELIYERLRKLIEDNTYHQKLVRSIENRKQVLNERSLKRVLMLGL